MQAAGSPKRVQCLRFQCLPFLCMCVQNARNVLVTTCPSSVCGLTAKLADLGLSRTIKQHNTHHTTCTVGTMSHMPPGRRLSQSFSAPEQSTVMYLVAMSACLGTVDVWAQSGCMVRQLQLFQAVR